MSLEQLMRWEQPSNVYASSSVDAEFVAAFESAGWTWGGRWRNADPMHFEWVG